MWQQFLVYAVILVTLGLMVWGRFRYELVALASLTVLAVTGVLEPTEVFHGFGNDAVLSVVAILVVGQALRGAGITEPFAVGLLRFGGGAPGQTLALSSTVTFFSAFMNNTGALAVFLPVAVHVARATHRLASALLMPLAFASLLGGLITLIGTPPNILVSSFRQEHTGQPYSLFDFTPVGLVVAMAGIMFLSLVGWRLIPKRRGSVSTHSLLRLQSYFSELRVPEASQLAGRPLRDFELLDLDVNVVGLVRGGRRIAAPPAFEQLEVDDLLLVEASGGELQKLIDKSGLELGKRRSIGEEDFGGDDVDLQEIVVAKGSPLVGRTAKGLRMRWRYGVNLLGISRQGSRVMRRLSDIRFRGGDVLLIQARTEDMADLLRQLKCFTLQDKAHSVAWPKLLLTVSIFSVAMVSVATNLVPLGFAFMAAALVVVFLRVVSVREAYTAIDWPVVLLLAATIPMGTALEKTGGADTLAHALAGLAVWVSPTGAVAVVMVSTMLISNVINNAATAVLMAPIAYKLSVDLGTSPDTFLMAVAVGASSCFLTPMGHQCNILVLGPGGYRFSDYIRLGLPLSLLVIAVGLPMILLVWPL